MKKSVTRSQMVVMTLLAALIVLAGWSYARLRGSCRLAVAADEDLVQCQELAAAIKQLREKPVRAASAVYATTELSSQIDQAGKDAKLPHNSLLQITADQSHRLGDSAYQVQPTRVTLEDVSLEQLVSFLHDLTGDEQGMDVEEISLTPMRGHDTSSPRGGYWSADIVLTHLIFSPKTLPRR